MATTLAGCKLCDIDVGAGAGASITWAGACSAGLEGATDKAVGTSGGLMFSKVGPGAEAPVFEAPAFGAPVSAGAEAPVFGGIGSPDSESESVL